MAKVVLNGCFGGFGLSKEAYEFLGIPWDGYGYVYTRGDRSDPKLTECVETLGRKANGRHAELYVEEYDDYNYAYEIYEYDGRESLIPIPLVHKSKIETMTTDEIVEYLTSLDILVVD